MVYQVSRMDIKKIRHIVKLAAVVLCVVGFISIAINLLSFIDYSKEMTEGDISQYNNALFTSAVFVANMLIPKEVGIITFFNWSPVFAVIALVVYGLLTKIN